MSRSRDIFAVVAVYSIFLHRSLQSFSPPFPLFSSWKVISWQGGGQGVPLPAFSCTTLLLLGLPIYCENQASRLPADPTVLLQWVSWFLAGSEKTPSEAPGLVGFVLIPEEG